MTFADEHVVCDDPRCTAHVPEDRWQENYETGWRGYFLDDGYERLQHHCGEHPVPTRLGPPIVEDDRRRDPPAWLTRMLARIFSWNISRVAANLEARRNRPT
jgi:hypothetical protein